jgi:hypothetical protein
VVPIDSLVRPSCRAISSNKENIYQKNVAVIKKYGLDKFKLTLHKTLRIGGWETKEKGNLDIWEKISERLYFDEEMKHSIILKKCPGESENKLLQSISRSRKKIFEYAYCNEWDYFTTMTIDPNKFPRDNLSVFYKSLSQFMSNYKKKKSPSIKFLFIPELHDDNTNWHIHGLLKGILANEVIPFEPGVPQYLIDKNYMNWPEYANRFGFVSLGKIGNHEATSKYMTKYISKDLSKSVSNFNGHVYYGSHGLKGAEVIKIGTLCKVPKVWEFENDYVSIVWISADEVNSYII